MPMRRRRRFARSRPRTVIQTFKKVLNHAPASVAAAVQTPYTMSAGVDSVAAGQTGPTDSGVPTGSVITGFDIQISMQNLINVSAYVWVTVQRLDSGQAAVDGQAVGGNPQRNQVHLQLQRSLGTNQNRDFVIPFKVPKKFQRVKEGSVWLVTVKCDQIRSETVQIIYKFMR